MARIFPPFVATQPDEPLQPQPLQAAVAAASYPTNGAVPIAAPAAAQPLPTPWANATAVDPVQRILDDYEMPDGAKVHQLRLLRSDAEASARAASIAHMMSPADPAKGIMWAGSPPDMDPKPIRKELERLEFDTTILPEPMRNVVDEIGDLTQAPDDMILCCMLTTISAAVQHLVNVRRDAHLVGPVALYGCVMADSGERKTTVDKLLGRGIAAWQEEEKTIKQEAINAYQIALHAWTTMKAGVSSRLKREAAKNPGGDTTRALVEALQKLEQEKPTPVTVRRLIRHDDTMEGLLMDLQHYPVAFISSSEGGTVLGSYGMQNEALMRYLATLNIGWDGGTYESRRKTSENISTKNLRIAANLLLQPEVILSFLRRSGNLARGMGLFARFLLTAPESTMGTRTYKSPKMTTPALDAFNSRIKTLLEMPANFSPGGILVPREVRPDDQAMKRWVAYYDDVELELGRGGEYFDVKDIAAKSAENAARIAGCIHTLMFGVGPGLELYGEETARCAIKLARHFLDNSLHFFNAIALPQGLQDAIDAEAWVVGRCRELRTTFLTLKDFQQSGPTRLRPPHAHKSVFEFLDAHNRVFLVSDGPKGGKRLVPHAKVRAEYSR